jgi:hypothetical protein
MKLKNTLIATALLASSALIAPSVVAAPFDIESSAKWTATVGGTDVNIETPAPQDFIPPQGLPGNASLTGSSQVNWGTVIADPVNNPNDLQSAYRFAPINQVGIADLTNPAGFVIGQFTHFNFTIGEATSITSADLELTVTITDQGGGPGTPVVFNFTFTHNETPNFPVSGVCAGTGITPVPALGCPDVVGLGTGFGDTLVEINGQLKTMQILGFLPDANNDGVADNGLISEFITSEAQANYALLLVTFSDPPVVPEPASIGLLGLGVLGIGWLGYRRRRHAA